MADDIETRLERELSERFPHLPNGEVYGVKFTGDRFEIHLHDDGSLGWTHRASGPGGTSTLPADIAGEMTTAIRTLPLICHVGSTKRKVSTREPRAARPVWTVWRCGGESRCSQGRSRHVQT